MNASTQLRALEGEIAELERYGQMNARSKQACMALLKVAQTLEKEVESLNSRDDYRERHLAEIKAERQSARDEAATLKRRLDEAMTALSNIADGNSEFTRAYAATVIDRIDNHMP